MTNLKKSKRNPNAAMCGSDDINSDESLQNAPLSRFEKSEIRRRREEYRKKYSQLNQSIADGCAAGLAPKVISNEALKKLFKN